VATALKMLNSVRTPAISPGRRIELMKLNTSAEHGARLPFSHPLNDIPLAPEEVAWIKGVELVCSEDELTLIYGAVRVLHHKIATGLITLEWDH
jgi:hypothetical protein